MNCRLIYVTARDVDEARRLARALVEGRLAAGANVLGPIRSIYWWRGKIHDEPEALLIAETTEERVPEVIRKVRELHSDECPCVVAVPIRDGTPDFLRWIENETQCPAPERPDPGRTCQ